MHKKFIPAKPLKIIDDGNFSWQSPSNIALVKYWGKYGEQLPKNPSISFTLQNCATTTTLQFQRKTKVDSAYRFAVFLDGKPTKNFEPKIELFFKRIQAYVPFLTEYEFTITTTNSFPHSSGIASSASGLSALALCLMSVEKIANPEITEAYFYEKASFLARLGSGSAARSVYGNLVVWGKHTAVKNSSDLYGTPYPYKIDKVFRNFQDTILLIDKGKKTVSSSVGHELMYQHPFAAQRFLQAQTNLEKLKEVLATGNLEEFIRIVESEALSLHAMMMTSTPYFLLMKPNTLAVIHKLWQYRKEHKSHSCFTLDAGANVHVLYPEEEKKEMEAFIENDLANYCQDKKYITDRVGKGPIQLN